MTKGIIGLVFGFIVIVFAIISTDSSSASESEKTSQVLTILIGSETKNDGEKQWKKKY